MGWTQEALAHDWTWHLPEGLTVEATGSPQQLDWNSGCLVSGTKQWRFAGIALCVLEQFSQLRGTQVYFLFPGRSCKQTNMIFKSTL